MPIIFDEFTAEIAPPTPTTSTNEARSDNARPAVDPQSLVRELSRIAERAERLNAD
jgi:hypothetical protein